jgi:hypothetical protein
MHLPAKPPTTNASAHHPTEPVDIVSVPKMQNLLAQAAQLAADAGLPPEAFASVAWHAYLRTVPGVAEQLAEAQLDAAIEQLRSTGRLAKA